MSIRPMAAPGSLLKTGAAREKTKAKMLGRKPREKDAWHLDAVRQCACLSCGQDPAGEAAHVRLGAGAGMGEKPDDSRTVPLCRACHGKQHAGSEREFWAELGIDPVRVAEAMYRVSGNVEAMRAAIFVAHAIGGKQ